MSYVIQAVLSNPRRPECGQITIPFPIPVDQYDQTVETLQAADLGFSINRDCAVDEVNSRYHVLNALVGTLVNIDQLDYLAKRLDSFCAAEAAQFQAMAQAGIRPHPGLYQPDVLLPAGNGHHRLFQSGGCRAQPFYESERRVCQDGGAEKPGWRRNRFASD